MFALSVYQVLFCCCCCSCIWASAENKNRGKGRKREREYCDEKNKTQTSPILLHMLKFFLARRDFQGNLLSKVFFFFFISELPFSVSSVAMVFRRSCFRDVACLSKQLFFAAEDTTSTSKYFTDVVAAAVVVVVDVVDHRVSVCP